MREIDLRKRHRLPCASGLALIVHGIDEDAQPLASATIGVARSSRQLGQSIGISFRIYTVQNLAQFDAVETQKAGKLAFAH